jgi:hypothetical protein
MSGVPAARSTELVPSQSEVSPYDAGSSTQLHLLLNFPPDANEVKRSEEEANAQDECEHK